MSDTYHGYSTTTELMADTLVLITGGSQPVAMKVDDRLSIEAPGDRRISAVVLDRSPAGLLALTSERAMIWFEEASQANSFDDFQISEGFSRELWRVVRRQEPGS